VTIQEATKTAQNRARILIELPLRVFLCDTGLCLFDFRVKVKAQVK